MKVKRLVEELQKYNPDAEVKLGSRYGDPILFALALQKDNSAVWLETEEHCNLDQELRTRFAEYDAAKIETDQFFMDLFETGITVHHVCTHVSGGSAKIYSDWLEEHDLI